jgi:hypothetical protein
MKLANRFVNCPLVALSARATLSIWDAAIAQVCTKLGELSGRAIQRRSLISQTVRQWMRIVSYSLGFGTPMQRLISILTGVVLISGTQWAQGMSLVPGDIYTSNFFSNSISHYSASGGFVDSTVLSPQYGSEVRGLAIGENGLLSLWIVVAPYEKHTAGPATFLEICLMARLHSVRMGTSSLLVQTTWSYSRPECLMVQLYIQIIKSLMSKCYLQETSSFSLRTRSRRFRPQEH